ncbi:hypothetical protein A3K80_00235 [Candidatus Bathyarchaeota archaeon RBG_13_38_9]|nr:MAG: hypothetical protein A3K80_00235 [Candidatus Bathyarchaeota archaeon RBG_13_38_9]
MLRTIFGLIIIIFFVWLTMLIGLVVIFASLPLLILTLSETIGRFFESIVVTSIASVMVLIWLVIWKELAFRYFSRMIAERQ